MTLNGWIFMIISHLAILSLTGFCFFKTFTLNLKEEKRLRDK